MIEAKIDTELWIPIILEDAAGADINGVVWNDGLLSVWYIKEGGDWVQKILTINDWDATLAGGGRIYKVKFTALELDTLGNFIIVVYYTGALTYDGHLKIVNNLNDDIAGLIAGLNNFDVTSEKVLLNDGTQGQIDAVETASGNLDDTISSRAPAGEYDAEMANLDASVSSRAVPGDITAAHAITDAKIDTIETNNITGVPE